MENIRKMQLLLERIPKGRVTTYKILAREMGVHPRQAGMILGKNPEPDRYACYKVVKSDGSIGGYGLGVKEKARRLRSDGVEVKNNKVSLKRHLFSF